jgi:hypothetical protein
MLLGLTFFWLLLSHYYEFSRARRLPALGLLPGVAAAAAEAARGAAPAAVQYIWVREDDGSARLSPGSGRGRRRTIPSELFTVAAMATLTDFIGTIWIVFTDPLGSRVGASPTLLVDVFE